MFRYFAEKFPEHPEAKENPTSFEIIDKCKTLTMEEKDNSLYYLTLELFLKMYTSAIGNFMANHVCRGGMYLVGSLSNSVANFLKERPIIEEFANRHPEVAGMIQ